MTFNNEVERRAPLSHHDAGGSHGLLSHTQDSGQPADRESPLRVVVVDRQGDFAAAVERAARATDRVLKLDVIDRPTRLMEDLEGDWPDVLLAGPGEMTTTGLRRLAHVHRESPRTVIGLVQPEVGQVVSMTAVAACGASEVISHPASTVKLRNALHRLVQAADGQAAERVVVHEVQVAAPVPSQVKTAKIFTVTSPTGGCGKTFFATNLAAYLAKGTGGRVLLIDLDLQFGEVSLALGMRPQRTIAELVSEDSLEDSFPEYVVDHSSGYKVLSAPADPFAAELVGPREATRVLEAARGLFDYIVVDTPPSLNEVVLAAFDQSRYLVVMATMDVPSLRNLRVFLETIDRLKLPAEDVSCVLNKAEPDNGIDLAELLRVYPGGFAAVLPYAKEVARSLNVGQPVLITDPRCEISRKIIEACGVLVPAGEISNPMTAGQRERGRAARRRERHGAPALPMPALVPGSPQSSASIPAAVPPPIPVAPPVAAAVESPGQASQAQPPPIRRRSWVRRVFGGSGRHAAAAGH